MSNPIITLTEDDIETLKHNGHLHRYTDDPNVTVTLTIEDAESCCNGA